MEINEEKTVDMLSTESVSILTRKEQTENVVNAVFAIWGSEPVVEEPIIEEEDEDYGEKEEQ